MLTRIILLFSIAVITTGLTMADEPASTRKPTAPAASDANTAKQQALQWLDKYAKVQVLFHKADVDRVRKELAAGSDEDALEWWNRTAEIRAALDSPEWKETQAWLREFLEVQAIFSDEEVDEFRSQAKEEVRKQSPEAFKKILQDVSQYRRKLARGSANARALREQQLQVVEAFRKEEAAARAAAIAQAASTVPPTPVSPPVKPRAPRQPTTPLIDSLDIARWSVIRGLWRF